MNIEEIKSAISALEREIKGLYDKRRILAEQLADLSCPYKIDQIMVSKRNRGLGQNKKEVTQRAKIVRIKTKDLSPYYSLYGTILRKDGKEGETRELLGYQHWEPENSNENQ